MSFQVKGFPCWLAPPELGYITGVQWRTDVSVDMQGQGQYVAMTPENISTPRLLEPTPVLASDLNKINIYSLMQRYDVINIPPNTPVPIHWQDGSWVAVREDTSCMAEDATTFYFGQLVGAPHRKASEAMQNAECRMHLTQIPFHAGRRTLHYVCQAHQGHV